MLQIAFDFSRTVAFHDVSGLVTQVRSLAPSHVSPTVKWGRPVRNKGP